MATQSGTLGRRSPWTKEAGGLQSMGSRRVGHDCQRGDTVIESKRKYEGVGQTDNLLGRRALKSAISFIILY